MLRKYDHQTILAKHMRSVTSDVQAIGLNWDQDPTVRQSLFEPTGTSRHFDLSSNRYVFFGSLRRLGPLCTLISALVSAIHLGVILKMRGSRITLGADSMMRRVCDHVAGLMAGVLALVTMATTAAAQMGQPAPGQMGFQSAASPVMEEISAFHDQVNVIIIAIAVFVLLLMLWVIFRYNSRSNPEPSKFSHNTVLEVAWTVVPILILVYIGVFSFKLLFLQYTYPKPDLTIKATGNAWYWDHSYPDQGDFTVTSTMIRDQDLLKEEMGEDAFDKKYGSLEGIELLRAVYNDARPLYEKKGLVRQLSVDNEIAVPLNAVVHMLVTSADVIHSWTIPSFGSKTQAVPGRLTATWFKATRIGVFYGQCSVICGKDHSSMPIAIRVVAQDDFDKWVEAAKAGDWKKAKTILLDATKSAKTDGKSDGKKVAQAGAAVQN